MGIFIVVNRTTELRRCMLTLCWTILYCNNAFNHVKIPYKLFYFLYNKNNLSCLTEIFKLCWYSILQDTNDDINALLTSCTRNLFQKHEFKLWYFFQFFLNLGNIKERSEKHWHFCLFVIQQGLTFFKFCRLSFPHRLILLLLRFITTAYRIFQFWRQKRIYVLQSGRI